MSTFIGLLRGINVGGCNKIAMAELRDMLESSGLAGVRTLLQSGNIVLDGGERKATQLERLIESETEKRFGIAIDCLIRSAAQWNTIIARNPFPEEAQSDPSHLIVVCMKEAVDARNVKELTAAVQGPELLHADGKQLYVTYPAGIAESKLTLVLIERKLGARGTGRNWSTVLKLAALAKE
jgi:uncharacterized protein (DUF1697 family)